MPASSHCVISRSIDLAPQRGVDFIAIRFKAGCASRFLEVPLGECIDRPLPLMEVMGRHGAGLIEAIRCSRRDERIALIQDFLLRPLADGSRLDARVAHAAHRLYYQSPDVQTLADSLAIGKRHLERRFKAQEGLSPVAFRQLVRFQRTARSLRLMPALPLAQAGAESGFADQAHMTREFRAMVGQTPEQLRKEMLGRLTFYCPSISNTTPPHGSLHTRE